MTSGKVAIAVFGSIVFFAQLCCGDVRAQTWPTPTAHVLCHSEKNEAIVYFTVEDASASWERHRDQAYRQATGHEIDLVNFPNDADTCSLSNGWEIKATLDYEWGSHVQCSPRLDYALWINKRVMRGLVSGCHYVDGEVQNEIGAILISETNIQECNVAWADDGVSYEATEIGYRCTSLGAPSSIGQRDYRSYPENNQPPYPAGLIATYRKDESLCRPAVSSDEGETNTLPDDIKRTLLIFPDNVRRTITTSVSKTGWQPLKWGKAHLAAENSDLVITRAIFDSDNSGRKSVVYEFWIGSKEIEPPHNSGQNLWLVFDQTVATVTQEKIVKDLRASYVSAKSSDGWIDDLYRNKNFRVVGTRKFPDRPDVSGFSTVRIGQTLYLVTAGIPDALIRELYYGHYHQNEVFQRQNFTVLYKPLPGGRFETICTYDQFGRPFSPYP